MLDFVTLVLVLISTLLIAAYWLFPSSKKITTIPGMNPSDKIFGNISDIGKAGSLHEFLTQLHEKYGKIVGFWFGQTYTVSIASPELFKQHASVFDRPVVLFKFLEPLVGPAAIQFKNGAEGKARRQYYDRAFGGERLMALFEVFQKCADDHTEDLARKAEGGRVRVPLLEKNLELAVKIALYAVLGQDSIDDEALKRFGHAYEQAWDELERRLSDPNPPDETQNKKLEKDVNVLNTTLHTAIEHRKATTVQGNLVIDEIIEFAATTDVLISDGMTYLVGAFHSTSSFWSWCLYFLACDQGVQEKLYKEIIDVLGPKGVVNETNIDQLKYMKQVFNEALRCSTIGPFAARCQDVDTELGGHFIPKNTPVLHAIGVVHHDKDVWPDPLKFDPERFNAVNSKSRHPFAFTPFGFAGKRKCPAFKYNYHGTSVFLATVLTKFKVENRGEPKVKYKYGIVAKPAEEVYVTLIRRT